MTHLVDVLSPPEPTVGVLIPRPPVKPEPDLLWMESVITEQLLVLTETASMHTQDIGPAFEAITAAQAAVASLRYSIIATNAVGEAR